MSNKNQLLAALVACSMGLAFSACGSKEPTTAVAEDGTTIELPSGIHYYTNSERKAKKQPTDEKLSIHKSLCDAEGNAAINEHEFEGNTNIKEVYFLNRITNIAAYAFANCTSLEKVIATKMVDVVNDNAFEGCANLKTFDAETRTVGLSAFANCTSLEEFKSLNEPYWIRDLAFQNCKSLKKVLLGLTMSKMEENPFDGCDALEEVSIPFALRRMMFGVLKNCKNMKTVYLLTTEYFDYPESGAEFVCEQVSLYVPDAYIDKFKGNASWSRFKEILPLSTSPYFDAMGLNKQQ